MSKVKLTDGKSKSKLLTVYSKVVTKLKFEQLHSYCATCSRSVSASSSVKLLFRPPADAGFLLRFSCFPVLIQAQATSYRRKLFLSTNYTTYSRDVLLNLRFEVARVQFISPVVARAAERILPASYLYDFRFPALHWGNRK